MTLTILTNNRDRKMYTLYLMEGNNYLAEFYCEKHIFMCVYCIHMFKMEQSLVVS